MKSHIYDLSGKEIGEIDLPKQFEEEVRPDLIKRAVLAIYSHKRQPYGTYKEAGKETSAWTSKRRRDYRTSYGRGISRVPRAVIWGKPHARGIYTWIARRIPNAVKGYRAHPPKAEKDWYEKINKKERKKAIRSAIAATATEYFVKSRGHIIPEDKKLPFVLLEDFENISKTKEVIKTLINLGLEKELERNSVKRIRAGKGKMRGRRYKVNRGILLVVSSENSPLIKSARNVPGVEIVPVNGLNAEVLAPGAKPGRLTLWSVGAIERLENEKLFF